MAVKNKYDRKTYIQRGIVFLFFSLFLFYGLLVFDDYGVSWDEPVQRYHSLVTYNDVVLGDTEYNTTYIETEDLPPIEEYGSNYGVIRQLPYARYHKAWKSVVYFRAVMCIFYSNSLYRKLRHRKAALKGLGTYRKKLFGKFQCRRQHTRKHNRICKVYVFL